MHMRMYMCMDMCMRMDWLDTCTNKQKVDGHAVWGMDIYTYGAWAYTRACTWHASKPCDSSRFMIFRAIFCPAFTLLFFSRTPITHAWKNEWMEMVCARRWTAWASV